MAYKNEYFSAMLNGKLDKDAVHLPVSEAVAADLLALLTDKESYIYLTIKGDTTFETVKARNEDGTLLLERGVEGTTAVLHPYGSCIVSVSPTVIAAIKDLVCSHNCCEEDCPVTPVAFLAKSISDAVVAHSWSGAVIFSGTAPVVIGTDGLPAWMNATQQGTTLLLDGTPTEEGTCSFTVAASNGNGNNLASVAVSFEITQD